MSIEADLKRLDAPVRVVEAGREIDAAYDASISPPAELVAYVLGWVVRNQGNNRYGR